MDNNIIDNPPILCFDWANERFKNEFDLNRFWSKVLKADIAGKDCWQWTAAKDASGYGILGTLKGSTGAHRISFAIHNPNKFMPPCVCHSCDNPICVNPAHLWAGSKLLNSHDAKQKGRNNPFPNMNGGQLHPTAKLSSWDVATIVKMAELNMPVRDLAVYFSVTAAEISRIANRKVRKEEITKSINYLENLSITYNKR